MSELIRATGPRRRASEFLLDYVHHGLQDVADPLVSFYLILRINTVWIGFNPSGVTVNTGISVVEVVFPAFDLKNFLICVIDKCPSGVSVKSIR